MIRTIPISTRAKSLFFLSSLLVCSHFLIAQSTPPTIQVQGNASFNLSPNEIIIKVGYQEYFVDGEDSPESKIPIEKIEGEVLTSLKKANIPNEKITMGAAKLVRPYDNRKKAYRPQRIHKTLSLCISSTDEYIQLIRQLEQDDLFTKIITDFSLEQFRHTDQKSFQQKSWAMAFQDAENKARSILAASGQKLGRAISIKEMINPRSQFDSSTYEFSTNEAAASGFSGIMIGYQLDIVFEILE